MSPLTTNVKNISDLMSIAIKAEREAIRRYSLLAVTMREGDNNSTADLFERIAIEEQEHEKLLLAWMTQEGIDENPDIGAISWQDPDISTTYRDEARNPHQSSPYKALAFAVHNEEIAFRFYTHVAANSDNEAVRKYAEILAREELEHMAILRAERRRAYHAERDSNKAEPGLNPKAVHNEIDLLTSAIHIDQIIIEKVNKLTGDLPELSSFSEEIQQEINKNETLLQNGVMNGKESPGEDITKNLTKIRSFIDQSNEGARTQDLEMQRVHSYCDQSFSFYNAVVETTSDESVMLAAQKLTSLALNRLGALEKIIREEDRRS